MAKLYYAGTDLSDFGVYVDTSKSFVKPEKRVNRVTVPGRSGDLVYADGGYENILIPYPCFIRENFKENFENLIDFLQSFGSEYKLLYTSNHLEEYRQAVFHSPVSPETGAWNRFGNFTLTFDCKPQIFLQTGSVIRSFTSDGTIENPTNHPSKPKITIYGNGSVTVNGVVITVTGVSDYVVVDCEVMDCYRGTTLMNNKVSFSGNDFPVLKPGVNNISLSGVTEVDIEPHWWHL